MKLKGLKFYFVICLCWSNFFLAQDIHWSQFNANPIFLNPANAGDFNGDLRFVGNRRSQWRSVTEPFTTTSISADKSFGNHFGAGVLFFDDVAGDGKFRTNEFQLNGSYKSNFGVDSASVFHFGAIIGVNYRQVNWGLLSFDSQYNGIGYDPSLPSNEASTIQKKSNLTLGFGAKFSHKFNKLKIEMSSGLFNINQPNQGFYGEKIKRDIRSNNSLKISYPLNSSFELIPSIQFQIQGKYQSLLLGSNIKYIFTQTSLKYIAFFAGGWLRNKDAFILSFGADYQNWFFGLSYDINTSSLNAASNFRGGTEFSLRYIIRKYKPKNTMHRICPDYI